MKSCTKIIAVVFAAAINLANSAAADDVRIESYPSNHLFETEVLLHIPEKEPTGLLVLLPAGNIHSYDEHSTYTPSLLPKMLSTNGVLTLIATPHQSALYSDAVCEELDGLVANIIHKYKIPEGKVAIGGFSVGGIGAVRYAQFCKISERKAKEPVAVFAVDSPLDFERLFLACELHLKRLALAGLDEAEDRGIIQDLRKVLGGSPTEAAAAYRRQSPVNILVADGGNARLLKDTPIRLYIEPDLKWRLENWNQDVYSSNIPDATALINILRLLGNKDAELIATSDKGRRPDGTRNPHSWSIVDESALAEWLIKILGTPKSEK
jgi:hypothetical protein